MSFLNADPLKTLFGMSINKRSQTPRTLLVHFMVSVPSDGVSGCVASASVPFEWRMARQSHPPLSVGSRAPGACLILERELSRSGDTRREMAVVLIIQPEAEWVAAGGQVEHFTLGGLPDTDC